MQTINQHNQLVRWRHELHMHPELGFEEKRTSAFVEKTLRASGIEVISGVGKTGVVGVLKKGSSDKTLAIRADMDALPITETNSVDYASKTEGVMHACGHDGHTTMLLGAADYLAAHGEFDGTVYFIFQPNEEHGLGAPAMIKDGLFDRFSIGEVYAMHNMPGMAVGTFATRAGPMTASESLFTIEVNAIGGHAALPHMGADAIVIGSEIVSALQTIVSRKLDPGMNGVVSVTGFETDGKRNVLPGKATLTGDARALTPATNTLIEQRMRQIVNGICAAHGVSAKVTYNTIFPPLINASAPVAAIADAATSLVGAEHVDASCQPKLFSEDFAHMTNAQPGCYVLMGNGEEGCCARPLHSADYDFNDAGLVAGSSLWVTLVEQQLVVKKLDKNVQ